MAAFTLVELVIDVDLDPDGVYSLSFSNLGLPNTGFAIENVDDAAVSVAGVTRFDEAGLLPGETVQEGFVLLDGTLELEVEALDPLGARASTRTTFQRTVRARWLERDFIRRQLVRQGVVGDVGEARARARAMDLADARVMRFVDARAGRQARWVRAVRAVRADVRRSFQPRMAPDGELGHYGTYETTDGGFVWAVMDRNSRYAVGLTVDRDGDGVANADDNCVGLANSTQSDADGDGAGDACDVDDDDDGIVDQLDNCPLTANPDQQDLDGDGVGDACDGDADGDGVDGGEDLCSGTALGDPVDPTGCSIADLCPCDNGWRNHGAYVRCLAQTSERFLLDGLITAAEKDAVVAAGAGSPCGF